MAAQAVTRRRPVALHRLALGEQQLRARARLGQKAAAMIG